MASDMITKLLCMRPIIFHADGCHKGMFIIYMYVNALEGVDKKIVDTNFRAKSRNFPLNITRSRMAR